MRKKRCIIMVVCLFVLCAAAWMIFSGKELPSPSPALLEAAKGLDDYTITMKLVPSQHTLSITEEIRLQNRTEDTLSSVVLRLWPNAYQTQDTSPAATDELFNLCYPNGFSSGDVLVHDVKWNGTAAEYTFLDAEKTVLSVNIGSWEKETEGVLYLRCVVQLPNCTHRTGYMENTYHLGNVLPLLSVYENGAWRQDAYSPIGEPFYTACANFHLTLHVPENYTPACSIPLTKEKDGVFTGTGLAIRDVGLCVSPDYVLSSGKAGDTQVLSFAKDQAASKRALRFARQALETYEALYGSYPYPTYTVCSTSFAPGAMEYPSLCVIDEKYFAPEQKETLELLIAHETAHQWFYALVGSDPVNQPWQDEAISEYAMLRYIQKRYGQTAFENLRYYRVDAPMQEIIPGGLTPGSPIHHFSSLMDYRSIVYGRGAALMLALDTFMQGKADTFLREYAETYAFSLASRNDFETLLNRFAQSDLTALVEDYLDTKILE